VPDLLCRCLIPGRGASGGLQPYRRAYPRFPIPSSNGGGNAVRVSGPHPYTRFEYPSGRSLRGVVASVARQHRSGPPKGGPAAAWTCTDGPAGDGSLKKRRSPSGSDAAGWQKKAGWQKEKRGLAELDVRLEKALKEPHGAHSRRASPCSSPALRPAVHPAGGFRSPT